MHELINKFCVYLSYPFVRYAFVVGILVALCSSLLGVTLVLKRFSFIGDGLSHVAFGAVSVATVLGISDNMFLVLPVTIICAVLLLKCGNNAKVKGDAAIAMVSVGALGVGYLIMNIFSSSSNLNGDVCTTLFGSASIMTLTADKVRLCIILSVIVVGFFFVFYHKLFSITFDENFAKATGINVNAYNLMLAVVIAVIVVLAMNLVGSLLVSALIVFPALSSMSIFRSFKSVTVFSVIISVTCTSIGIIIAILASTPVGPTIVAIDLAGYLICRVAGVIVRR
ncbi:MAG: metal ABC transporter permease [Clostridia bacterium]|nr:metal ABC transporter permease [Clostridia bacterium]